MVREPERKPPTLSRKWKSAPPGPLKPPSLRAGNRQATTVLGRRATCPVIGHLAVKAGPTVQNGQLWPDAVNGLLRDAEPHPRLHRTGPRRCNEAPHRICQQLFTSCCPRVRCKAHADGPAAGVRFLRAAAPDNSLALRSSASRARTAFRPLPAWPRPVCTPTAGRVARGALTGRTAQG